MRLYLDDNRLFLLNDEQRGQIVAMMLAADQDGNLPNDPQVLAKLCRLDSKPNLQVFEELGFLEGVPALYTECTRNVNTLETKRTQTPQNETGTVLAHKTIAHEHDSPNPIQKVSSKDDTKKISPAPVAKNQIQLFQDAYNAIAEEIGLARSTAMNPKRQQAFHARLKEHGPDGLAAALDGLRRSKFCQGDNDRGWKANIDFVLRPGSCQKLIEGAYEHAEPKSNMQKAMELIDAQNGRSNGSPNSPKTNPVLPQSGADRPESAGYIDVAVDEPFDWAG